ncbi:acyl-CoA dehydrogenase family protein [Amycolatopsis sp. PS_44_ISF1]|uniref:acyl-CoA dehydrogenase family protein n=1 Tax=Amycolatopsis sp. PS_44_ISF1 TaxID=2974917 RepID=UPI0028DF930A|nr:acyl-CoA dehydrogenase family protein [Amycolatopsis sp. PS_44_ISF1]MDT8913150.1 acyl-CoA dehydrogenase family protein [Amycolatopsis sp. PS_44_ISF1]
MTASPGTARSDPDQPGTGPEPRTPGSLGAELRRMLAAGDLDLPVPGRDGPEALTRRWAALSRWGRRDLALARLAEGHADAVAILAEAGLHPEPLALYGVWAAKSGGTGAAWGEDGLRGTVRFCSGLTGLDRALVVAGEHLVEVDLTAPGIERHPEAWQSVGMDASDSGDVRFEGVPATEVGPPGWYVARPGFVLGGTGVAAVWLGGAAGLLDAVCEYLRPRADEHQLAHLGALHTAVRGSEELLRSTAAVIERSAEPGLLNATCRASVEHTAREVVDRAPRITGPALLCRDRRFAQHLADLQVFIRQHHAERDLAALGRGVLEQRA